jgi:hypothetical protein
MVSTMVEEVNCCDQCGTKIRPNAKFCSNCGCAVGEADQPLSSSRNLLFIFRAVVVSITIILGATWLGNSLYTDMRFQQLESEILAAVNNNSQKWKLDAEIDQVTGKNIVRRVSISSRDGLCSMTVGHFLHYGERARHVIFSCPSINFNNRYTFDIGITFDGNDEIYDIRNIYSKGGLANKTRNSFDLINISREFEFDNFIKKLSSADILSMRIEPQLGLDSYLYDMGIRLSEESPPVWISFSVKNANEVIAMLGKELKKLDE